MTLPRISIVTPSLNQAQFIRATIESVLGQAYPNLDYRVMDGGSNDGTLEILQSYGDRLRWQSGADQGQTDVINRGWAAADGEILAWLNSDDFYYPDALVRVGKFFEAHPDVDLLYGDCAYVDARGEVIRPYPTRPYHYSALVIDTHNYIPQPATFIRRRAFESAGRLNASLSYIMDMEYWMRLGLRCQGVYLPERLAALRLHESAKSIHQLGGFAQELVNVYQAYFKLPEIPGEILAQKRQAMSNIYLRAADIHFWSGNLAEARRYALQSARLRPFRPRTLWLYLALGRAGVWLARRRHENPYFPGTGQ
jgi:glycosyltransferase involved in cell wall biosynthesis